MPRVVKRDSQDAAPRDLGRYRLHGEIASGGMATVHFGRQVGTGGFAKTVAIKRLHPQFAKIPEFCTMFLTEARLAARIRHPNVVQPLDMLQLDDEIFLVMEYVDGDSLSRLMKATVARQERVEVHVGVSIICAVLHGLHAAHEAKSDKGEPLEIVHRDVSPQNILVGVDGVPRVIDFGIAKAADSVQITREGELKGKLSYMSPEQLNGGKVTRKIDIYAASVVLWEMLTGQRLFDADYQSAILKNILHRPVDAPSEIADDVPHELDEIVMRGLAKDPNERWSTAREMALALEERIVLANPSHIGRWVERVASGSLQNRAERIAEIEAIPSDAVRGERAEDVVSDMILVEPRTGTGTDAKTDPTKSWKRTGFEPPPPTRAASPAALTPSGVPTVAAPTERLSGIPTARASSPVPSEANRSGPVQRISVPAAFPGPRISSVPGSGPVSSTLITPSPGPGLGAPQSVPDTLALPQSPPRRLAATMKSSANIGQTGSRPPPPTISVPEGPAVAPEWPVPGILPAPATTVVEPDSRKRSSGGGVLVLLLVVAAALAGFYLYLPELIRKGYVASAAREGLTLAIDQVEVSMRSLRLVGVSLSAPEVPGVTVRAQSVDLAISRIEPVGMTAHGVFVSIDGSYTTVHDAVAGYLTAHGTRDDVNGTLKRVAVDSAHVVWNRPLGEATKIEAENVSGAAERVPPHAIGDDLDLDAPIVHVTLAAGKVGPWHARWHREGSTSRVKVDLDALGTSGAQANLKIYEGAVQTLELAVPRVPFPQIGVPLTVLGRKADDALTAEGALKYNVLSPTRVQAQAHLLLAGLRLTGAQAAADVEAGGHFEGDPAQPLELQDGVLAFGPFRGRLSGPVTVTGTYVKTDLVWKSAAVRCATGDQTVTGVVKFDSRSVDDTTIAVLPSAKCGLKVFAP